MRRIHTCETDVRSQFRASYSSKAWVEHDFISSVLMSVSIACSGESQFPKRKDNESNRLQSRGMWLCLLKESAAVNMRYFSLTVSWHSIRLLGRTTIGPWNHETHDRGSYMDKEERLSENTEQFGEGELTASRNWGWIILFPNPIWSTALKSCILILITLPCDCHHRILSLHGLRLSTCASR